MTTRKRTNPISHFQGAYRLGHTAAFYDALIADCPYPDLRKPDGGTTFSRAYINAWKRGWRAGKIGEVWQLKLL
jgi:hypothetical protein